MAAVQQPQPTANGDFKFTIGGDDSAEDNLASETLEEEVIVLD